MSVLGQKITDLASTTQENLNHGFREFENAKYVSGTKDFLNSNSLVAKFAFLILVLLVFILALRLAFQLLNWAFAPSKNPYIFKGSYDARRDGPRTFSSNPNLTDSIPILRSTNQNQGVEFTWSVWILIDSLDHKPGIRKHIFHKGGPILLNEKTSQHPDALTQAPGLWIEAGTNTLIVRVDVYDDEDNNNDRKKHYQEIPIPGIPLNKWINVMIRAQGKILDVFINGAIVKRYKLQNVVNQNYGDTYILENGGFEGEISNLTYFSHALNVSEILDIVNAGPNLTQLGDSGSASFPPYLALRWYFQQ